MLGLLLILPFAFISSHKILGHRPYYEQVAESKARLQLGADYADYQYFARRVDSVFHTGVSVTIRASLVAYNTALNDVQEVAVTWKEPWRSSIRWSAPIPCPGHARRLAEVDAGNLGAERRMERLLLSGPDRGFRPARHRSSS